MISSGRVSAGQWSLLANMVTLRRGMIAAGRAGGMIYFWSALNAPPVYHLSLALNTIDPSFCLNELTVVTEIECYVTDSFNDFFDFDRSVV